MINYELAKELKEAGFPLKKHENQKTQPQEGAYVIDHVQYYIPTLEELIEACGEEFYNLYRIETPFGRVAWYCNYSFDTDGPEEYETWKSEGKTQIEAVARLWLALNKK